MAGHDDYPFRFRCRRSGNCCAIPGGVVRVTPADVAAMAAHLGMPAAAFASRYLRAGGTQLQDGLGHRCVFLEDGGEASCAVYPVRPAKCRQWPFWSEVLADDELRRRMLRICPGLEPLPPPADA